MDNNSYASNALRLIWSKAYKVSDRLDRLGYRKDAAGAWIQFSMYGDRGSETNFGWEVDHIVPKSHGGSDDVSNLRPLHWMNNLSKSDNYPNWKSSITSEGDHNVRA